MPDNAFDAWMSERLQNNPQFAEDLARLGTAAPAPPGPWSWLSKIGEKELRSPAWGIGQVGKFGWEALKGLLTQGANAIQAVNPLSVSQFGATDPPRGIPGLYGPDAFTPEGVSSNINYRLQRLGNAVEFGLPDAMQGRIDEVNRQSPPRNVNESILNYGRGVAQSVGKDILPGGELVNLLRGDKDTGRKDDRGLPIRQPLSAEEAAQEIGSAAVKILPWAHAPWVRGEQLPFVDAELSKVVFGQDKPPINKVITVGDLEAAKNIKTEQKAVATAAGEDAAAVQPTITPEAAAMLKFDEMSLSKPQLNSILGQVVNTEVYKRIAATSKGMVHEDVVAALRQGAFTDEQAGQFVKQQGLPPGRASEFLANAIDHTAKVGGDALQQFSLLSERASAELMMQAQKGDMLAKQALKNILKRNEGLDDYHKAVNFINNGIETPRRALMVGNLATTLRNFKAQGLGVANQLFEHLVSGTVEAVSGVVKGKFNVWDAYGDLASDFTTLIDRLTPSGRATLEESLTNIPLIKAHIEGGTMFDASNTILNNIHNSALKGLKPEGTGERIQAFTSLVNTANRMQELEYRHFFYQQRLEANLKARGWKSGAEGSIMEQFNNAIKNPEALLGDNVREAIADAADHALKQTFGADFNSGLMGAVLKTYKSIPGMTALFPPYPRFLMNQWRWQMERSPVLWFDLFDKPFREQLTSALASGVKTREAARVLGKATSGLMLLNGAWVMRNSDAAGPKYYQFKPAAGPDNPQGRQELIDIRDTQPFVTYLGIAEAIKSITTGQPLNMTRDEKADFLAGVRRLSDYVPFDLVNYLRNMDSDNLDVQIKTISKPIGSWLGSFFTPLRQLNDIYGGVEETITGKPSDTLVYRDTAGVDLIGPAESVVTAIPAPNTLPARPDPFTGEAQRSEHPFLRQFTGTTFTSMTKLKEMVMSTPGLELGDLLQSWGTPEANRLMYTEIGKVLTTPTDQGHSLGDEITGAIERLNLTPEGRAAVLQNVFSEIREKAMENLSEKLTPEQRLAFGEHALKSLPPIARPIGRDLLRDAQRARQ